MPTTFFVTNLSDGPVTVAGDLPGSLRQAVFDANAFVGHDHIVFDASLIGTINLTQGEMNITNDVSLFGNGADKTVINNVKAASPTSRVFKISGGSFTAMSNLTISGGNLSVGNGAGIFNSVSAALQLNNVIISKNQTSSTGSGGGLANEASGTVTLSQCRIVDNSCVGTGDGGGISNQKSGVINIMSSTISGNQAGDDGGGIDLEVIATLTVINSTISNNVAKSGDGGGLYYNGWINTQGFQIRNSTISDNSALSGGGIAFSQGNVANGAPATIQNCTIVNNTATSGFGGGIAVISGSNLIKIESSIVSGNNNLFAPDVSSSGVVNVDFSAIGSKAGFSLSGFNNLPFGAKLNLGPLSLANGGATATHMPGLGSPVRGRGSNPAALASDQRGSGYQRLLGAAVDIGAVESFDVVPIAIASAADVKNDVGGTYSFDVVYEHDVAIDTATIINNNKAVRVTGPNGFTTLAQYVAIDDSADGSPRRATYRMTPPGGNFDPFDNGIYTISIEANQVLNTSAVAVPQGPAGNFSVLFPQTFVVSNTLDGLVTAPGQLPGSLRQAIFDANTVGSDDVIQFDPTQFATAKTIVLKAGQLTINDSVTVAGPAGGVTINANSASRVLQVNDNTSLVIAVSISNVNLTNGRLLGDANRGAGVFLNDEILALSNCNITGNLNVEGDGGGIFAGGKNAVLSLLQCNVSDNVSEGTAQGGGGLRLQDATLTIHNCTLANNSAKSTGGAISWFNGGPMSMIGTTIVNNYAYGAQGGGGGFFFGAGPAVLQNCTFANNRARTLGGALCIISYVTSVTIQNSTIIGNISESTIKSGGGGGIYSESDFVAIQSSIIADNVSSVAPDIAGSFVLGISNSVIGVADTTTYVDKGGNLTGTKTFPYNALIGTLGDYGGTTLTFPLLPGSPAINKGSNLAMLATDQRGLPRMVGTGVDIGAFETQPPAKVNSLVVNDGSVQRSRVTTIAIAFSQRVTIAGAPAGSFELKRQGDNANPAVAAVVDNNGPATVVTLSFSGAVAVDNSSLADGRYTLTIHSKNITTTDGKLDGNGDGIAGDNYVLVGNTANGLFRLFGDIDGNGMVTATDFSEFRAAYGTSGPPAFDFDNNGVISAADFAVFRTRYGVVI